MEKKKKEKEVNLSDLDANFIISSFKNKERRNNPSSIPRPLLPPKEEERKEQERGKEGAKIVSDTAMVSNSADKVNGIDIDSAGAQSDASDSENISGTGNATEETIASVNNAKRTSSRQRKAAFEEYQKLFLQTPKIVNRKPVFISESTRDCLNKIARKLGDDNMSASGFLENLALHHLDMYHEDIEAWRKL